MVATSTQFPSATFQASTVLQTVWLGAFAPPALKGGVTAKFAFQASYAFQASAFLLTQDTWEVLPKDFCFSKSFATASFFLCVVVNGASWDIWDIWD